MFDFVKNEHRILKLWQDRDVLAQMRDKNKNAKELYRTLDGPITANGSMCLHHCWGRTFKDAMIKYNTLKGRKTHFQNGFDAQGMWVEVEVEKLLGLNDKKAILDYGLANFTEKCIERVNYFADMQTRQSIRLGQIMDWENSYFTNSDHNIECIWNFLKVCHERGMLVRSYKSMPWCPRCGTSLSEHEMNGSFRERTHKAVFAKARLVPRVIARSEATKQSHGSSEKLLIWTTTPWTLSSNAAIAVNPTDTYVKVRVHSDPDLLIVGKQALKIIPKKDLIEIVEEFPGSQLLGRRYEPMLPLKVQSNLHADGMHIIIPWDEVSATEGTGAVHIAPGSGAADFELGKKHNLKQVVPINEAGILTDDFEYLAGLNTEQCEPVIFDKLRDHGTLFYVHDYSHNYPFCWRCKTNVVFKLVDGWDIATAKIKLDLIKAARTVKWDPPFLLKTMEHWLENMGDWNISRRRFYGLPLPIYPCDCGHVTVIGSKAELKKLGTKPELVDKVPHLHRPYIDEIEIKCKCGKHVKRVPDVGDCWLDAGIATFSTKAKDYFPAQAVIEMKEQIRLWFYSLLFMSIVLKGKAPYEKVVGYGIILDENGKMFSKTGPNNIKFDDAIETFGADVTRYLLASGNSANDVRFGPSLIDEARRKLLAFYNTVVFFKTYYDIDKPDFLNRPFSPSDITDKWLTEIVTNYVAECEQSYENYKLHEVIEKTEALVEDLSNFYIRVNRKRFWKNSNDKDKLDAYSCLYGAIVNIAIVLAPITPFLSEHIWQTIVRPIDGKKCPEFCMTADFPQCKAIQSGIVKKVKFVQNVISLALSLRARENLKLKQPLRTLYIKTNENLRDFENILRDEVNVKEIKIVTNDDQFNVPYLTVNFKKAGAILKDKVQDLKTRLEKMSDVEMSKLVASYDKGKDVDLYVRNLKSKTEFVSSTEGDLTVVLDTTLDDELIEEGILREIIRTIQVTRQDQNFDIVARVKLKLTAPAEQLRVIEKHKTKICEETLATELVTKVGKELNILISL